MPHVGSVTRVLPSSFSPTCKNPYSLCHLYTTRLLEAMVDVRHESKDVQALEAGSSNLINILAVLAMLKNLPETPFVATKNIHLSYPPSRQ